MREIADSLEILNVVQRDFSCETVERFLLHQADQSGFDFIVLSSAGRPIDCGASGGEFTRKVPLSDGSALLLDLLSNEVGGCLASNLLCVDCRLHLLHLSAIAAVRSSWPL